MEGEDKKRKNTDIRDIKIDFRDADIISTTECVLTIDKRIFCRLIDGWSGIDGYAVVDKDNNPLYFKSIDSVVSGTGVDGKRYRWKLGEPAELVKE